MRTKDLIKRLQELDPSGEAEVITNNNNDHNPEFLALFVFKNDELLMADGRNTIMLDGDYAYETGENPSRLRDPEEA